MSKWVNIKVLRRFSGILSLLFIIYGVVNKLFSLYDEAFISSEHDWVIVLLLSIGLFLQSAGGTGIVSPVGDSFRKTSFMALYFVSGFELALYVSSSILVRTPEICDTVVTARGGDPVRLAIGEICFLMLLGSFHWTDSHFS